MLVRSILLAIFVGCAGSSSTGPSPGELPPKTPPQTPEEEGQHFCCAAVNLEKRSGEDCVAIGKEHIAACSEILYCAGNWGQSKGTTKCLD